MADLVFLLQPRSVPAPREPGQVCLLILRLGVLSRRCQILVLWDAQCLPPAGMQRWLLGMGFHPPG